MSIAPVSASGGRLKKLTEDERALKPQCKISDGEFLRNGVGILASAAVAKGVAVIGGAAGVAAAAKAAAITSSAPVGAVAGEATKLAIVKGTSLATPMGLIAPYLPKQPDYLGFMHLRHKCAEVVPDGKGGHHVVDTGTKKLLFFTERGRNFTAKHFCSVWSTLSWNDVRNVRITVVPSTRLKMATEAFEASGAVSTSLRLRNRRLVLVISTGDQTMETPLEAFDRLVYSWCGQRPVQTKWHITYENGVPETLVPKPIRKSAPVQPTGDKGEFHVIAPEDAAHPTGHVGVWSPDRVLARQEAEMLGVYEDGSSGTMAHGVVKPYVNPLKQLFNHLRFSDITRLWRRDEQVPLELKEAVIRASDP